MPKVIRLFLKDVRHLWPEILLVAGLSAAYAATQYLAWPAFRQRAFDRTNDIVGWTVALLFISWCLLIARAVQDETLVGDRQFWLTRPYGWASILGAKLLFIAGFILFPFFIAQCSLVHRAGISIVPVIPSLLLMCGGIFCLLGLPLFALSAITSSIARIILVVLGLAVYISLAFYAVDSFVTTHAWQPYSFDASICLLYLAPAVCAAVVLVQYSLRRIGISIALLLALVATVTAVGVIGAKTHWLEVPIPALAANEQPPVRFALGSPQPYPDSIAPAAITADGSPLVIFRIPLKLATLPERMEIITGSRLNWEVMPNPAGGDHPHSDGWNPSYDRHDKPGDIIYKRVIIPRRDWDANAQPMLSLQISFSVEEFMPLATDVVHAAQSIDVPENGHCVTVSDRITDKILHPDIAELVCMYAGRNPSLTRVQYVMRTSCSANSPAGSGGVSPREEWVGENDFTRDLAWPGVVTSGPGLTTLTASKDAPLRLCPGEPITFTRFRMVRKRIVSVDLPPFDPTPYMISAPDSRLDH